MVTKGKALSQFTVFGRRVRAHNADCASSFREDRKHGLVYPPVEVRDDDGTVTLTNWPTASVVYNFCVYCGRE